MAWVYRGYVCRCELRCTDVRVEAENGAEAIETATRVCHYTREFTPEDWYCTCQEDAEEEVSGDA